VSTIFTHFRHRPERPAVKKPKKFRRLRKLPAAIDIGTSSVKLLQLVQGHYRSSSQGSAEYEVIYLDKESYGMDKTLSPVIYQKEALRRILSRNSTGSEVVASISAKDIQMYNLDFPAMVENELADAIRYKITQLRPFGLDVDTVLYDFIKWDNSGEPIADQQKVLVVCVSKQVVERRIAMLQEVGLKPIAIEVSPFSLVNLDNLRQNPSMKEEVVVWLDIGGEESSLVVGKGSILYFSRMLGLSAHQMTKQISSRGTIPEKDAEALKKEYGLSSWSPDKKIAALLGPKPPAEESQDKALMVYRNLISSLEGLVVDIQHSFKYFSYQITQSQITKFDRIIVAGGGSQLKDLERFLSVNLGVPAECLNPFSFFAVSEDILSDKRELLDSALEFTNCAGMALSTATDDSRRINLMPKKAKRAIDVIMEHSHEKPVQAAVFITAVAILLIILQVSRLGFYSWKIKSVSENIKATRRQLSNMQSDQIKLSEEEARLIEKKTELRGRLDMLKKAMRHPEAFSDVLAQVAEILPSDIWVTQISYTEDRLTIKGSTEKTDLVIQLIEDLKISESFNGADFNYSQKEPDIEIYNFEVIALVRK